MVKTTGLGQGVGALFGDSDEEGRFFECDIEKIVPNKHQPRVHFDTDELEELTQSIQENGVIQPLIVSYIKDNNLEMNGAPYEVYVTDPQDVPDPSKWITELYWPIK